MSIPMAPSSEIFIDDILKKSLIFKEKRLDLIGRKSFERTMDAKDSCCLVFSHDMLPALGKCISLYKNRI